MILVISVLQSTAVSQEILIFQEAFKLSWRSLVLCYSVCKFQLLFSFTIIFIIVCLLCRCHQGCTFCLMRNYICFMNILSPSRQSREVFFGGKLNIILFNILSRISKINYPTAWNASKANSVSQGMFYMICDCRYKTATTVCVVFVEEGFWGFGSDDNRLSSWQSKGLACVTESNCRRLDETLSGTFTNPKANCRPDKDKLSFSSLSGSSCRAKFTRSSLILGQSDWMWTEESGGLMVCLCFFFCHYIRSQVSFPS